MDIKICYLLDMNTANKIEFFTGTDMAEILDKRDWLWPLHQTPKVFLGRRRLLQRIIDYHLLLDSHALQMDNSAPPNELLLASG